MTPKKYTSVIQQVKETSASPEFAKEVKRRIESRQIIKHLMALRALKGLSQKELAEKLKCTQSRISKLENGTDDDLRLGDFSEYVSALGMDVRLVLTRKGQTPLDEIKYHAFSIRRILDRLVHVCKGDDAMSAGASKIMAETFYNMTRFISGAFQSLSLPKSKSPPITMEVQDDDGTPMPTEISSEIGERALR